MEDDALARVAASTARIRSVHERSHHGRRAIHGSAALVDPAPSLPAIGYVHRPFTHAVLNPTQRDILDFVRDADEMEASLFAPPSAAPLPTYAPGERIHRAPVRRAAPLPPTPLRAQPKGTTAAANVTRYRSTVLLQTASTLAANYEGWTRLKNTIASLTADNREKETERRRIHAQIAQMQQARDRVGSNRSTLQPSTRNNVTSDDTGTDAAKDSLYAEEIAALKQQLQHEELEEFALEQIQREHLDQVKRKTSPAAAAHSVKHTREPSPPSLTPALAHRTEMDTSGILDDVSFPSAAVLPTHEPSTATLNAATQQEIEGMTTTDVEPMDQDGPERPAPEQAAAAAESESQEQEVMPVSTPELERVSEKIWALWGGILAYVWPDRTSGDYYTTLQGLEVLVGLRPSSEGTGPRIDPTVIPPPRANELVSAYVLVCLLRAEHPHTIEFDQLKQDANTWWDTRGRIQLRMVLEPHVPSGEVQRELEHSGDGLATRAVYGLQAKKLLMVRRKAGKSPVGFAGL